MEVSLRMDYKNFLRFTGSTNIPTPKSVMSDGMYACMHEFMYIVNMYYGSMYVSFSEQLF